jgi:predicted enzyme related to lactoylglutathione lyase
VSGGSSTLCAFSAHVAGRIGAEQSREQLDQPPGRRPDKTTRLPWAREAMINFRVRDLDAMLVQLRAKGADVAKETQDMEGVGRFGWVTDPEGNRIELWQPA